MWCLGLEDMKVTGGVWSLGALPRAPHRAAAVGKSLDRKIPAAPWILKAVAISRAPLRDWGPYPVLCSWWVLIRVHGKL